MLFALLVEGQITTNAAAQVAMCIQITVRCTLVHDEVTTDQLPVVVHVYDGVTPPVGVYPLLHVKYVVHPMRICGSG